MKKIIQKSYPRTASWLLMIYLSIMVSGCSFRPTELTPEEARLLQTREFNRSTEETARAAVVVLQEMHYTLGNVDMGLGLITAERLSEYRLAPISRELTAESEMSDELETFCIIAGTVAVVGVILALIFDDDDDEEEEHDNNRNHSRRHRSVVHSPGPLYLDSGDSGPDAYRYAMTITLEETSQMKTRVRLSVQGHHLEGSSIVESGPVHASEFYADFYSRLHQVLNN